MAKSQQRNPSQDLPTAQLGRANAVNGPPVQDQVPATNQPSAPVVPDDDVSDEQRAGALAVVASGSGLMRAPLGSSKAAKWGEQRVASSMPVATEAQRLELYAAIELCDRKAKNCLGEVLEVVHWVQYDFYPPHRETGEIQHKVRTVLVCADGRSVDTGSDSAAGGLQKLLVCLPVPPWNPPRRLKFGTRTGSNGDYYVIDPRC